MIADKRALNQILINLVSNAIRFTDRGGKVTVSARAEAANITFAVEDNGVGINDEDLARVGEPYFQAGSFLRPPSRRHRASAFPSSRGWCGCTAASFRSAAASARARA